MVPGELGQLAVVATGVVVEVPIMRGLVGHPTFLDILVVLPW